MKASKYANTNPAVDNIKYPQSCWPHLLFGITVYLKTVC